MVGGADDDSVHFLLFEQAAVVLMNAPVAPCAWSWRLRSGSTKQSATETIWACFGKLVDEEAAAVAHADHADADAVTGENEAQPRGCGGGRARGAATAARKWRLGVMMRRA